MKPAQLADVLSAAHAAGVSVEYVETNSSWAVDRKTAEGLLGDLFSRGLQTLLISISPFHNESIPYARVLTAMAAAEKTGIGIFPWVSAFMGLLARLDAGTPHGLEEFEALFGDDFLLQVRRHYWIHMGGRALETFRLQLGQYSAEQIIASEKNGCGSELSDTSHFHIDLHGRYIPGLCAGLAVDGADLGRPLSPDRYPLTTTLAAEGVRGLCRLAREQYGYQPRRLDYINKCDLCTDIRVYLFRKGKDHFEELHPSEFYQDITDNTSE